MNLQIGLIMLSTGESTVPCHLSFTCHTTWDVDFQTSCSDDSHYLDCHYYLPHSVRPFLQKWTGCCLFSCAFPYSQGSRCLLGNLGSILLNYLLWDLVHRFFAFDFQGIKSLVNAICHMKCKESIKKITVLCLQSNIGIMSFFPAGLLGRYFTLQHKIECSYFFSILYGAFSQVYLLSVYISYPGLREKCGKQEAIK